jgi:isoamylase
VTSPLTAAPGREAPLGATPAADGVNFALFSQHADKVELCLFDAQGDAEIQRLPLRRGDNDSDIWCVLVPGLRIGARYGYRVHGPYEPEAGHRFNPNKLLIDPYARRLDRPIVLTDRHFGFQRESADDCSFDERDSAEAMPRCIVEAMPPLRRSPPLRTPDPLIYEAHVRGMTRLHPALAEAERGTFAGLSAAPVIAHLKNLGIDAIELMPVQYGADEPALQARGLRNYWGYNSVAFFAPAHHYLAGDSIDEICATVDVLHDAGIEVILDVAFNHSGEGDEFGPTLCFRGLDNLSYYRLDPANPRAYINDTGCGNTLNIGHPQVLRLVMDSLRYWAGRMGVDGFRFDLASTLARDDNGFNPRSGFFAALQQDPILSQLRLIAEPWDVGPGGYQLGNFPRGWLEWNDRYRDSVRRFWRGDSHQLGDFARRLHGSSEVFEPQRRGPQASVNFVSCHDGFTLADLVSYEQRHNEANGESNRDGHSENFSCNHGVEGPTDNDAVKALRIRQRRNLLATLLLSQGTPMLLSGDELGRSQHGNNNAYCQDNALNWFPWDSQDESAREFHAFTADLIALRRRFPLLRWPHYMHSADHSGEAAQCHWLHPDGRPMSPADWHNSEGRCLCMLLSAPGTPDPAQELLLVANADEQPVELSLPTRSYSGSWQLELDTGAMHYCPQLPVESDSTITLEAKALCLLAYGKNHADDRGAGEP